MKETITLAFSKETKTTYRFDAPEDKFDEVPVQSIYVKRRFFKGEKPESVTVTIEA